MPSAKTDRLATASIAHDAIATTAEADLVVMDIAIEGSTEGFEGAAEARERFRIPVVALSEHAAHGTGRGDAEPSPELATSGLGAPAILLVDERDRVRLQLHNFFEANGYDLLEAADREEAVVIAQIHERVPDVLIADASQAEAIAAGLGSERLKLLRVVEGPEAGVDEIRRPFSEQALLLRVEALLRSVPEQETAVR